ncbi:hypothetical protein WJX74_008681 [Apatococcus lobatus]|uniref:Uncharacterized protein n=1 Tax=Apatococcus lobatus TaxID=904363 RepID=A0AAW1QCH6_9CHLO
MAARAVLLCLMVALACQLVAGRSLQQVTPSPVVLPSSTSTSANSSDGATGTSSAAEGGNPNSATSTSSTSAPSSSSSSGSATGSNGTSVASSSSSSPQTVTYYCGSGLISVNLGCNSGATQPLTDLIEMYSTSTASAAADGNILTCSQS